jgi:anti-sigma factor RsiW
MPNCRAIDPLITPYVDRELPDADRQRVDEHLRVCAPCHSRVAAEQAVRDLVHARQLGLCHAAPPLLRAKCSKIAAEAKVHAAPDTVAPGTLARRSSWASRLAPMAMAASLVTVVGGAFLYQATHRSARLMAAQLAADHIKCFAINSALGTHEKASAVESTMLSSFDWRVHLPAEPSRAGLELVGARPCLYGEGKIAHIMYRHDGRPVSLFMLPHTERKEGLVEVLGHEAAIWCANNRTFVLVSREPKADVQRLASFVQTSLH